MVSFASSVQYLEPMAQNQTAAVWVAVQSETIMW